MALKGAFLGSLFATNCYAQSIAPALVCKAAIAEIMGRDPRIVQIVRSDADVHYLSYVRQSDQSKWTYRCRVDGNRVIWASDPGRWRTDPRDGTVKFDIINSGRSIKIIESVGGTETYELSRLK